MISYETSFRSFARCGSADCFMNDGAPPHLFLRLVILKCVSGTVEGQGGPTAWPACSPDLNPLHFYLWGHPKSVYATEVSDIQNLQHGIQNGV
jgi:hypothetical protein